VVTTNASALPEVVDHEQNGLLVERNDVAGYVEATRRLGEDAALRQQFGAHGREKVARSFGYQQLAQGFLRVYHRLVS
jgi:glycosyltransferase involved in cell wall biosynthesis